MNTDIFYVKDNKIGLNTHKVTVRHYLTINKENYVDETQYVNSEGLKEIEVNFVPKHQLYEIVLKEELDTSEYLWMEGIELRTSNRSEEISEIASYGSLEAYEASLPEVRDEYLLSLDCRVSMMELGIN